MPTSQHDQISKVMELIITLNPNSILDIGVGFGKYGVLCREYLEFWDGREDYHNFKTKIDGIEAFEDYLTPLHDFIYDNIYVGNALNLIDELDINYDLVLLIDVFEHFDKSDGKELIIKLLKECGGILISIPKNLGNQKDAFDNPYEIHKGQWSKRELAKLGNTFFLKDSSSFILYIGKAEQTKSINKKIMYRKVKKIIRSHPSFVSFYYAIVRAYQHYYPK